MNILHSGDIVTYKEDYHSIVLVGVVIGYARAEVRYSDYRKVFIGKEETRSFRKNITEQVRKPDDKGVSLASFEVMVLRIGAFSLDTMEMDITKEYVKALLKQKLLMPFDVNNVEFMSGYSLKDTGYRQENFESYMLKNVMQNPILTYLTENEITGEEILGIIKNEHNSLSRELNYAKQFIRVQDFELGHVYLAKYKKADEVYCSILLCVSAVKKKFLALEKDITKSSFEQDLLSVAAELAKPKHERNKYVERIKKYRMGKFSGYDKKKVYYFTRLHVDDMESIVRNWNI